MMNINALGSICCIGSSRGSLKKLAVAAIMGIVAVGGWGSAMAAPTFIYETFASDVPSEWTLDGFAWQASGGYSNGALRATVTGSSTYSVTIPDVVLGENASLSFWRDVERVSGTDSYQYYGEVNISTNSGTSWVMIGQPYDNTSYIQTFSLSDYANQTIWIRISFRRATTGTVADYYAYLDDISIVGARHTITFDANGGTVSTASSMTGNTSVTWHKLASLPTPSRDGYAFTGWFTLPIGGTEVTTAMEFDVNATIYAQWIPTFTITFDASGGAVTPESGVTNAYRRLASLPVPTKDGHFFNGWFTMPDGGTEVTTASVFDADITIYAQWMPAYTITFDPNGGVVIPESGMTTGAYGRLTSLPTPTRTAYTFAGWFTEQTGGAAVTLNDIYSEDAVIYARWTPTTYTISYTLNQGTVSPANRTSYTVETETFTLNNPTRSGYTFMGWTGTGITKQEVVVEIAQGSTGNREYTANWMVEAYGWFGDGSATTFTIRTATELRGLADIVGNRNPDGSTITGAPTKTDFAGKTINLVADIELTGTFNPIGAGVGTGTVANPGGLRFEGTFDGNGHKITGLRPTGYTVTNNTTDWPVGLFSIVGEGGVVRNLGVSLVNPPTSRANGFGGIAGVNYGTITNCYNTGNHSTAAVTYWNGGTPRGGIVGINYGTVSNCYNTGNITGDDGNVGGIVGHNSTNTTLGFAGIITNSYNAGEIIVANDGSGGGVAGGNVGSISVCYNTGNVRAIGDGRSVGGVVGGGSGTISNCYNTGNVIYSGTSTSPHVGGVVGLNGHVSNCYNTGNISSSASGGWQSGINARNELPGSGSGRFNVSLGLSVSGGGNAGRVMGTHIGTLSNNGARSDMRIKGAIPTNNKTADGINGADISLGTPLATVFSGWDTNIWDIPAANLVVNGALPTLKAIPQESPPLLPGSGSYTVTYNENGGAEEDVPVDGTQYFGGSTVTALDAGDLARLGYTFAGWNTAANGSGTSYSVGSTFIITTNVTLYARWALNTYSITFDGNGSTGGEVPAEQTGGYNTAVNVRGVGTLVRDGYAFVGWNTAADGSGTSYAAANARFIIPAENTTLYAQWAFVTNAVAPIIITQPVGGTVTAGAAYPLSVTASVSDGGTLSYQWYSNTTASNTGGTFITGATSATYSPSTAAVGTFYYYVVIANTNNNVNGQKTAAVTSSVATISVGSVSVLSPDRTIPQFTPNEDAAVIAPVNVSAFEVSVGPNPIRKSDNGVNIFITGKRVDNGTLTVYDATGNVVTKINIRDNNVLGNTGRRIVGSWDLRDVKGRPVAEGAYLVRGAVKTVDGRREKVSVVVGGR